MTLSERILSVGLVLALSIGAASAADPPEAAMAAASQAIGAAERLEPRGPAADQLAEASHLYGMAGDAMSRRKYKDALRLAEQARAKADQAAARARLIAARAEIEEKTARNADLRRQLQMGSQR